MIIRKEDIEEQKLYYIPLFKKKLFIHPTQNGYNIGCDARNEALVQKIRLVKHWQTHPFNVIAPNIEWIKQHTQLPTEAYEHLPGDVTLITHIKETSDLAHEVHLGTKIIGIRFPNHWMRTVVSRMGIPIVSTCANRRAEQLMTCIEQAHPDISAVADIIIDEGTKKGCEPIFIDYTTHCNIVTE